MVHGAPISSRGPESRTRTLLLPRQAAFQHALTPMNGWGRESRTPTLSGNNRACCQLHHTPKRTLDGSRRNRTAVDRLMRSALYRLSYRAAARSPPDHRGLARKVSQPQRRESITACLGDDRKNFCHNLHSQSPPRDSNSPPLDYQSSAPPSELRGPTPDCARQHADNRHSTIANRKFLGGPGGSRTHYPSIKSRRLILMSFRPCRLRVRRVPIRIRNPHAPAEIRTRIAH
jgi:hypothetical protein